MTKAIPSFLSPLAGLSARLGNEIELVQAAGGNTSLKHEGRLWVKASGLWLSEALDKRIFVPLDLARVQAAVNGPAAEIDAAVQAARIDNGPLRPSIETSLHALLPQPVVVHVHGINSIVHAMLHDGRERIAARLGKLDFAWIPYVRPGVPLTVAVRQALAAHPTNILFLENHGLVVGASTVAEVERLVREVERRLALPARPAGEPAEERLAEAAASCALAVPIGTEGHAAALDRQSLALAARGAFCPDHVVFLGPSPAPVIAPSDLAAWLHARRSRGDSDPAFVLIPGLGVLARRDLSRGAHEMLRFLGLVLSRVPSNADVKMLSREEEDELLGWDAEKYRRSLDTNAVHAD